MNKGMKLGRIEIITISLLALASLSPSKTQAMSDTDAYNGCLYWPSILGPGPCTLRPIPADYPYGGYPSYAYYSKVYGWYYMGPIMGQPSGQESVDRSKGGGRSSQCGVENIFINDPINPLNGNEYFTETDYKGSRGITFKRFYNSIVGGWTYTYSRNLFITSDRIDLIADNGEKISFNLDNGTWKGVQGTGTLIPNGENWKHTSYNDEISYFDKYGVLTKVSSPYNEVIVNNYYGTITLTSSLGDTGTLKTAAYGINPLYSATFSGTSFAYQNDSRSNFTSVTKTWSGSSLEKTYLYENTINPRLLTGVIDERGVRYLTLTYDSQDRATSSETAGIGKISITYESDGSSTLTNEHGKKSIYRAVVFNGIKRISSIKGEPSPNCPESNSSYTYNDQGQILTKTDALGHITSYTYNDRGLEITRIEATGTPLARTFTTEWDPSLPRPVKIVEPNRTTTYTYDNSGRRLSQQTTSN